MKKISNEENVRNLNKRKVLRVIIIVLLVVILIMSIICFFYPVLVIPTLILYIVSRILTKYRESIVIRKK